MLVIVDRADDAVRVKTALESAAFIVRHIRTNGSAGDQNLEAGEIGLLVWEQPLTDLQTLQSSVGFTVVGNMVVLARATPVETARLLDLGVDDVVYASITAEELVARVRAVHRRVRPASSWQSCGIVRLSRTERVLFVGHSRVTLTQCECALLSVLLDRVGDAVSRAELLGLVWSDCKAEGSNFLNVHITRLRQKLGAASEYLQCVRGVGYRLQPPLPG